MNNKHLDLILIIAAAFFVISDIVLSLCLRLVLPKYVTNADFYQANGRKISFSRAVNVCPCLLGIYPSGTDELIEFKKISSFTTRIIPQPAKQVAFEKLKEYPFLVSLTSKKLTKNLTETFVCNGLVVSEKWLVTSETCRTSEDEWYNLTVRSQSPYWSVLGQKHVVKNLRQNTEFHMMKLEVSPKFSKSIVPKPPITFPVNRNWSHAISLGWNGDPLSILQVPHKKQAFSVEKWTTRRSTASLTEVCQKYDGNYTTRLLITNCNQLVAIKWSEQSICTNFSAIKENSLTNVAVDTDYC